MRISAATATGILIVAAAAVSPASAQYRRMEMQPMDRAQILSQGTAVQVPLMMLADPRHVVAKASVQDKDGHQVGSVDSVMTDQSGHPSAVKVDIGGTFGKKIVSLNARAFLFEQDRDVLIANMTQDEIKALPAGGT